MNGDPRSVLIAPVVSEKSYGQIAERRKYTFRVHSRAHKTQVRDQHRARVAVHDASPPSSMASAALEITSERAMTTS